jgi:hypothetical protein
MEHSPEAVDAAGKMSEALETLERARGHLYSFHQLVGEADFALDDAVEAIRAAGAPEVADRIERELIGRNVIPDRWTFQLIEEFDDGFWQVFRDLEHAARAALTGGERHLHEARLKGERRL